MNLVVFPHKQTSITSKDPKKNEKNKKVKKNPSHHLAFASWSVDLSLPSKCHPYLQVPKLLRCTGNRRELCASTMLFEAVYPMVAVVEITQFWGENYMKSMKLLYPLLFWLPKNVEIFEFIGKWSKFGFFSFKSSSPIFDTKRPRSVSSSLRTYTQSIQVPSIVLSEARFIPDIRNIPWVVPLHSNSGKWRFIGIPY